MNILLIQFWLLFGQLIYGVFSSKNTTAFKNDCLNCNGNLILKNLPF